MKKLTEDWKVKKRHTMSRSFKESIDFNLSNFETSEHMLKKKDKSSTPRLKPYSKNSSNASNSGIKAINQNISSGSLRRSARLCNKSQLEAENSKKKSSPLSQKGKVAGETRKNSVHDDDKEPSQKESVYNLSQWGLPSSVVQAYKSKNIDKMFEWQYECLSVGNVLEGGNLVFSAPTSAGKTLVAEILMLKKVVETKKKAIMILPFVSVVREKVNYFQEMFESAGVVVDGYMGAHNPPGGFKSVNIAICTIEKANNLINRLMEERRLNELGILVVDELHMLGDQGRGYLLELLLTKLLYNCKQNSISIQIVGMSATLPNLDVLAHWLDSELFRTDFRPVPLQELVKIGSIIYDAKSKQESRNLKKSDVTFSDDLDHTTFLSIETITAGHGVLIFCPSKNWCENLATSIAKAIYTVGRPNGAENGNSAYRVVGEKLREHLNGTQLNDVILQLKNSPAGLDAVLGLTVPFGVAFHHAGLTFDERDIIEGGFRQGILKILVATTTLSSGVNLPARRVIIRSPMFAGKVIDVLCYKQMVGRAGRKGIDDEGESILLCKETERSVALTLVSSGLNAVKSCLLKAGSNSLHSSLKRALIEVIASGVACTQEEVLKYISCTLLYASLAKETGKETPNNNVENSIENCIKYLIDNDIIFKNEETKDEAVKISYKPSRLGVAILASGFSPDDALRVLKELQLARRCFVLENDLHILYEVTPPYLSDQMGALNWMHFLSLWENLPEEFKRVGELVGVQESFIGLGVQGRINRSHHKTVHRLAIHQRFYASLALNDLIQEMPLPKVSEKYDCSRGILQSLQQTTSTFAGMLTVFCNRLGWQNLELLFSSFQRRVHFGIQQELCDLIRLSTLNAQRARALYNAGYETISSLAGATTEELTLILCNMGAFESAKQLDGALADEAQQRYEAKRIRITGKEGVNEREAASLIIHEARNFIKQELGISTIAWKTMTAQKTDKEQEAEIQSSTSISETQLKESNSNQTLADGPDLNNYPEILKKLYQPDETTDEEIVSSDAQNKSLNLSHDKAKVFVDNQLFKSGEKEAHFTEYSGAEKDLFQYSVKGICTQNSILAGPSNELNASENKEPNLIVSNKHNKVHRKTSILSSKHIEVYHNIPISSGMYSRVNQNTSISSSKHSRIDPNTSVLRSKHIKLDQNALISSSKHSNVAQNIIISSDKQNQMKKSNGKSQILTGNQSNLNETMPDISQSFFEDFENKFCFLNKRSTTEKESLVEEDMNFSEILLSQTAEMGDVYFTQSFIASTSISNPHNSSLRTSINNSDKAFINNVVNPSPITQKQKNNLSCVENKPCSIDKSAKVPCLDINKKISHSFNSESVFNFTSDSIFAFELQDATRKANGVVIHAETSQQKGNGCDKTLINDQVFPSPITQNEQKKLLSSVENKSCSKVESPKICLNIDKKIAGGLSFNNESEFNFTSDSIFAFELQDAPLKANETIVHAETLQQNVNSCDRASINDQIFPSLITQKEQKKNLSSGKNKQCSIDKSSPKTCLDGDKKVADRLSFNNDSDFNFTSDSIFAFELQDPTLKINVINSEESQQKVNNHSTPIRSYNGDCLANIEMSENTLNNFLNCVTSENQADANVLCSKGDNFKECHGTEMGNSTNETSGDIFESEDSFNTSTRKSIEFAPNVKTCIKKNDVAKEEILVAETSGDIFEESFDNQKVTCDNNRSPTVIKRKKLDIDCVKKNPLQHENSFKLSEMTTKKSPPEDNKLNKVINQFKGSMAEYIKHQNTENDAKDNGNDRNNLRLEDQSLFWKTWNLSQTSFSTPVLNTNLAPTHDFTIEMNLNRNELMTHDKKENLTLNSEDNSLFNSFNSDYLSPTPPSKTHSTTKLENSTKKKSISLSSEKVSVISAKTEKADSEKVLEGGVPNSISSFNEKDINFKIIEVSNEDLENFLTKLNSVEHFSLSVACEKVAQRFNAIGPPKNVKSQLKPGQCLVDPDIVVKGLAFCYSDVSYYTFLSDGIARKLLQQFFNDKTSTSSITAFDVKSQYKMLWQACNLCICQKVMDPSIAAWLLDPSIGQDSLKRIVNNFWPEALSLIGEFDNTRGSLGLQHWSKVSGMQRATTEAYVTYCLMKKLSQALLDHELLDIFKDLEMPAVLAIAKMEQNGLGFDAELAVNYQKELQLKQQDILNKAYQMAGRRFNILSTRDVSRILYKELKLNPALAPGSPSTFRQLNIGSATKSRRLPPELKTNKECLEKIIHLHPLPKAILDWRRLSFATTKVLMPLLRKNKYDQFFCMNRLYSTCYWYTLTGRVNVHSPNLQFIPRNFQINHTLDDEATNSEPLEEAVQGSDDDILQYGVSLRNLIIPSKGCVLMAADYSQLELRILAHLSGDRKLRNSLNSNDDVFKQIAANWKSVPISTVTDEQRQQAKRICYGMIYGISAKTLSQQLNTTEDDAAVFMETFKTSYPGLKSYFKAVMNNCQEKGYVTTLMQRRRYLPLIRSNKKAERAHADRQAINTTIQGSAADLIKAAAIRIEKDLQVLFPETSKPLSSSHNIPRKPRSPMFRGAVLVLQMHDELIYEVNRNDLTIVHKIVKDAMEKTTKLSVKLPVAVRYGASWGTLSPLS